ncbi:MAG: cation:proton antiporter [Clostridiales bacterium]|jgi:NhaP-type Na+/H+ or K+/H+ antiporter|nr:cation:proton antiporter [Clostridiales bacterium]
MLFSLAIMFLSAIVLSAVMEKLKLPGLVGMLLTGAVLGPYALDLVSPKLLAISADLRQIALIVILVRAGLALNVSDLKKVGRASILMCFGPATFEIAAVIVFAPMLFPITHLDAAIMGAVLGAVSPAVIVPKMLALIEKGYGKARSVPQLVMAGAAVDDIYVIVLFATFIGMKSGNGFNPANLAKIPISVILGLSVGVLIGIVLIKLFQKVHMRDTFKILILLSSAFLLVSFEELMKPYAPVSGLLAVMAMGCAILKQNGAVAKRLSIKFSKIWIASELMLFVLVGAEVDAVYALKSGFSAVVLIIAALLFRMLGVLICLAKTPLRAKERIFCAISYTPKATVQAAIGGLPLAYGLSSGKAILTVAAMAILITAPLGSAGINASYKKLLEDGFKEELH